MAKQLEPFSYHDELPELDIEKIEMERVEYNSPRMRELVAAEKPFVTKVTDWPALEWTFDAIRDAVGDAPLELPTKDGKMHTVDISRYLDMILDPQGAGKDWAIPNFAQIRPFRPAGFGVDPNIGKLLDGIKMPEIIPEPVDKRLSSVNVWTNYSTQYKVGFPHADGFGFANFNLQITGSKRAWLFSPNDSDKLGCSREHFLEFPLSAVGVFADGVSEEFPNFDKAECHEAILEPGDMIYMPPWWFHWFTHFPGKLINLQLWWSPLAFDCNPLSVDWAFVNATAEALGGWATLHEKFAELPAETQKLLMDIENALLRTPRTTDPLLARDPAFGWDNDKFRQPIHPRYFNDPDKKVIDSYGPPSSASDDADEQQPPSSS